MKLAIKERPYNLLLLTSIVFFSVGLFTSKSTMDLHLHDTYIILPLTFYFWVTGLILILFWFLYIATRSLLFSKKLIWAHTILTILISALVLIFPFIVTNSHNGLAGMPRRYYDYGDFNTFNYFGRWTEFVVITFFVFLFGQLTYIINIAAGVYKILRR